MALNLLLGGAKYHLDVVGSKASVLALKCKFKSKGKSLLHTWAPVVTSTLGVFTTSNIIVSPLGHPLLGP